MKLIIPMAGNGKRFQEAGYSDRKPFVKVNGKEMIDVVLNNLSCDIFSEIIFILKQEDSENLLKILLKNKLRNFSFCLLDNTTEGAACTVLSAYSHLDTDEDVIIANCDQYIDFNMLEFIQKSKNCDGMIACFESKDCDKKWSYAKVSNENIVTKVAEKSPISKFATCGVYYFKSGKTFIRAATKMISKNIRTNNEFYLCPVYNEMVDEQNVKIFLVKEMWGLGTPEDLDYFHKNFKI